MYDLFRQTRIPVGHCNSGAVIVTNIGRTDEEIIRAVESAPFLEGADDSLVQISEDTVVKLGHSWDSTESLELSMELVRKQTRIPVPRMRRIIPHLHSEGHGLIVMDLVPNSQQLRVAWLSVYLWKAQNRFDNAPLPPPASTRPTYFVQ
jgi:hypothetical protein